MSKLSIYNSGKIRKIRSMTIAVCASILALCAVVVTSVYAQQLEKGKQYISKWSSTAVSEMRRSGVPASITLAQGMLESGYGL
ncbi:MAG: glucosaminidase domain-containing protein, partial [Bacteroidales bacterium]|nr:glucosaminidase domain-containing protein [Bacteroidales bacterium]